jgi:hypothetical protein
MVDYLPIISNFGTSQVRHKFNLITIIHEPNGAGIDFFSIFAK